MSIRLQCICFLTIAVGTLVGTGCSPGASEPVATSTTKESVPAPLKTAAVSDEQTVQSQASTELPAGSETSAASQDSVGTSEMIGWDALDIGMQADVVYRPFFLQNNPRTDSLNGKRVRIGGFIHGGVSQPKNLKEFILLKNNRCKYGPGGQADHLIRVYVKKDVRVDFTTEMVYVEGVLTIHPDQGPDGNTWSLYDLQGDGFSKRKRL